MKSPPQARSTIQDVINSLEQGIGSVVLKSFILLAAVLALFGLHAWSQFRGLTDPDAMDYAQLAGHVAGGDGFTTSCIRPADLSRLVSHKGDRFDINRCPDIRHAPLHPALLGAGLKILRRPDVTDPSAAERTVILPMGILFCIGTAIFVFLIGLRLFDRRVAVVATSAYLVTHAVLADSISGGPLPLAAFLCAAAIHASLVAALKGSGSSSLVSAVPALCAAGIFCGLAFLTLYPMAVLVPAVAVFVAGVFKQRAFPAVLIVLALALAVASPWLARNVRVSGRPLGIATHTALNHTRLYPGNSFDRTYGASLANSRVARAIKLKVLANMTRLMERDLRSLGSGILICFFLVSLFHRFENNLAESAKWAFSLGLLLLLVPVAVGGPGAARLLNVFWPLVAVFGTAFFFVLVQRAAFWQPGWETVISWALVVLTGLPAMIRIAALPPTGPYPPVAPRFIAYAAQALPPAQPMVTDIPWATAWYGHRLSVLVPESVDGFLALRKELPDVCALYLTTETAHGSRGTPSSADGTRSWLPVLEGHVPPDFPFTEGVVFPPGTRDQVLLFPSDAWAWPGETALPPADG